MRSLPRLALLLSLTALLLQASAPALRFVLPPAPVAVTAAPRGHGASPKAAGPTPAQRLAQRRLVVPVHGIARGQLHDTFLDPRSMGRSHKAIDIMASWGTPVVAADDGKVARISSNRAGGLAVYQVDASGQFVYYYAHLSAYREGLREGELVKRGEVLGYVGTTGNAPRTAPHLHFAVQAVSHEGRWWKGEPINPYAALRQEEDTAVASHS
jgi:murein DD-endopeptidase MepM/ murein hydrolase activator NlpD